MGLMVHSLAEFPLEARRRYYMYLLDYGWSEPVMETVMANFAKIAAVTSRHDAVVIRGTPGAHFADEVLSWHHVNGQPADEILPAILLTTRHPQDFQLRMVETKNGRVPEDAMLLVPLRAACKSRDDVVPLLEQILKDITERKKLSGFHVATKLKKGIGGAIVDALILEPNVSGMGLDLKKLLAVFDPKRRG